MGGKSRKTGGISKSLIDRIKSGGKITPASAADSKKAEPKKTQRGFDFSEGDGDE